MGKRGNIKDVSLSGLAQTDLLSTAAVRTVVQTLVLGADHSRNISGEIGLINWVGL